jgi:hypothetical protein
MNKIEILTQLRQAKSAHIQWRAYAQALVAGIPVDKDHVPVIHTNCAFGKWYYGRGQQLSSLSAYRAIETPHEMLHQIYMKLFNLLFGEGDSSFFKRIFGSKGKLNAKGKERAEELMRNLISVSETLLEAVALLEGEVKELPEEELANMY